MRLANRPVRLRPLNDVWPANPGIARVSVLEIKQQMRERAIARRQAMPLDTKTTGERHGAQFFEVFGEELDRMTGRVVSGYWPIRGELDVRPLLNRLADRNFTCALPVVIGRAQPLMFRKWAPGDQLIDGGFGTRVPANTAVEVIPDIVLAPLLAFDDTGSRLGYGGGYYDRTLRQLRRGGSVLAVGVAFDSQRVDAVPCRDGDERLDWVITQSCAIRCRS